MTNEEMLAIVGQNLRRRKRAPVTPDDVLRVAARDPLVHAIVNLWKEGELSWDEALAYAVVTLTEQNQRLMENVRLQFDSDPGPGITVPAQANADSPQKGNS